jgi:hypothetical protein
MGSFLFQQPLPKVEKLFAASSPFGFFGINHKINFGKTQYTEEGSADAVLYTSRPNAGKEMGGALLSVLMPTWAMVWKQNFTVRTLSPSMNYWQCHASRRNRTCSV